jgi:hypothetical protein
LRDEADDLSQPLDEIDQREEDQEIADRPPVLRHYGDGGRKRLVIHRITPIGMACSIQASAVTSRNSLPAISRNLSVGNLIDDPMGDRFLAP